MLIIDKDVTLSTKNIEAVFAVNPKKWPIMVMK
jgi:hypothetical protein